MSETITYRLVEHDGRDAARALEHLGASYQDPELRAPTGPDHEGLAVEVGRHEGVITSRGRASRAARSPCATPSSRRAPRRSQSSKSSG